MTRNHVNMSYEIKTNEITNIIFVHVIDEEIAEVVHRRGVRLHKILSG